MINTIITNLGSSMISLGGASLSRSRSGSRSHYESNYTENDYSTNDYNCDTLPCERIVPTEFTFVSKKQNVTTDDTDFYYYPKIPTFDSFAKEYKKRLDEKYKR